MNLFIPILFLCTEHHQVIKVHEVVTCMMGQSSHNSWNYSLKIIRLIIALYENYSLLIYFDVQAILRKIIWI